MFLQDGRISVVVSQPFRQFVRCMVFREVADRLTRRLCTHVFRQKVYTSHDCLPPMLTIDFRSPSNLKWLFANIFNLSIPHPRSTALKLTHAPGLSKRSRCLAINSSPIITTNRRKSRRSWMTWTKPETTWRSKRSNVVEWISKHNNQWMYYFSLVFSFVNRHPLNITPTFDWQSLGSPPSETGPMLGTPVVQPRLRNSRSLDGVARSVHQGWRRGDGAEPYILLCILFLLRCY